MKKSLTRKLVVMALLGSVLFTNSNDSHMVNATNITDDSSKYQFIYLKNTQEVILIIDYSK